MFYFLSEDAGNAVKFHPVEWQTSVVLECELWIRHSMSGQTSGIPGWIGQSKQNAQYVLSVMENAGFKGNPEYDKYIQQLDEATGFFVLPNMCETYMKLPHEKNAVIVRQQWDSFVDEL